MIPRTSLCTLLTFVSAMFGVERRYYCMYLQPLAVLTVV